MKRKNPQKMNYIKAMLPGIFLLLVIVCWQNLEASGEAPAFGELIKYGQNRLYTASLNTHMPAVTMTSEEEAFTLMDFFQKKIRKLLPITSYSFANQEYDTQVESTLSYEMLMAREGADEQYRDGVLAAGREDMAVGAKGSGSGQNKDGEADGGGKKETAGKEAGAVPVVGSGGMGGNKYPSVTQPVVQISREKLGDFDYLVQNFYVVDKTTTIDSSQLNAQELLSADMKLHTASDKPQILIHHTHSQEEYVGSTGEAATRIVGVGEYLAKILREQYGYNVIHDTGEYDVIDHDNAYSYAGPAVEQILKDHPSIQVVIDMHRDGLLEGHLVTETNGKQTAKIMFFNGLSRTTSNGELAYLHNPYIKENLAFSLQMKVAADEYYPGFARQNYLKGYRYNLHYVPKSMLVEVGAQTNTVEEAMNAMEPLADLLDKVLGE